MLHTAAVAGTARALLVLPVVTLLGAAAPNALPDQEPPWRTMCGSSRCNLWGRIPHRANGGSRPHLMAFSILSRQGAFKYKLIFNHPAFRSRDPRDGYVTVLFDLGKHTDKTWRGNDRVKRLWVSHGEHEGTAEVPLEFLLDLLEVERMVVTVNGQEITLDLAGVTVPLLRMVQEASRRWVSPSARPDPTGSVE